MDLKEKKILILSIFIVLLSSWFIGNLTNLGVDGGSVFIFLPKGSENAALVSAILLFFIPISYISYISYRSKKENDFMFSKTLLLLFWVFVAVAGMISVVIFGFLPLTILFDLLPDIRLPFDISSSFSPSYLDMGFILLLFLFGIFFAVYIYLKVYERRIDQAKDDDHISRTDGYISSRENVEKKTIEDSLSSTLDKAITEIGKGGDVRSTIINSYHEMTKVLEEKGAENDDYMTPREFKDQIIKKIPNAEDFVSNITFLFEEARYSPHELEEKNKKEVIRYLEKLKEEIQ